MTQDMPEKLEAALNALDKAEATNDGYLAFGSYMWPFRKDIRAYLEHLKSESSALDKKYFASDRDKFLFFVQDGAINFEKFSAVYGDLPDEMRQNLFDQMKRLPMFDWENLAIADGVGVERIEQHKNDRYLTLDDKQIYDRLHDRFVPNDELEAINTYEQIPEISDDVLRIFTTDEHPRWHDLMGKVIGYKYYLSFADVFAVRRAHLEHLKSGGGWQDIASAPRDGTEILIFGGTYHHGLTGGEFTADIDTPVIAYWCDIENHWEMGNTSGIREYSVKEPTHWMPLPKPPSKGGE